MDTKKKDVQAVRGTFRDKLLQAVAERYVDMVAALKNEGLLPIDVPSEWPVSSARLIRVSEEDLFPTLVRERWNDTRKLKALRASKEEGWLFTKYRITILIGARTLRIECTRDHPDDDEGVMTLGITRVAFRTPVDGQFKEFAAELGRDPNFTAAQTPDGRDWEGVLEIQS